MGSLPLTSLERVQVVGRWKYRSRERVPEFTRERDERLRMLVNSSIREVDRIGVRGRGKSCAARPQEGMQLARSEEQLA